VKISRKDLLNLLLLSIDSNNGKLLNYSRSRGNYYIWQRDRAEDQSYFMIRIRGNYIVAQKIRYMDSDGVGINTFLSITIPSLFGQEIKTPKTEIKEILRVPISEYAIFSDKFKKLTPSLDWGG
jgi:hypothetical protein